MQMQTGKMKTISSHLKKSSGTGLLVPLQNTLYILKEAAFSTPRSNIN